MLLKITHTTDLSYSELISESVMELRMAPRQEDDQHRLSFSLAIGPAASVTSYFDWLGNTVHAFTVNAFHQQIRIVATSVVEIDRPERGHTDFADTWPVRPDTYDHTIYDYLQFDGPIVGASLLRELAREINPVEGMPLGHIANLMLSQIHARFEYKKGVTHFASPVTDMIEHGGGVCQDFTHLMIGLARAMNIPARYVSGFIHPDREKFRGYTQTHAWCELLFPSAGWVGFDPVNKCIVGENFVKVAIGRDFRDVPPNKGLYRGKATETIDASVQSDKLLTIPPELAAERFRSIAVPVYTSNTPAPRGEVITQQQEQQQQQA